MKRIKLFTSIISFLFVTLAHSQTGIVTGKVIDSNGETLIGASILVKGTLIGTIADLDGNYTLPDIPIGTQTIVVSFMGYSTKESTVQITDNSTTTIDFTLEEDTKQLEEFVVIGYGAVKKEDATGAIEAVTAKDFNQGSISSPQELITGKVAGVQITSAGGAPGSGSTIRIRGGASLNASNDPLIIIDGVPIDNNSVSGMRNPLNTINPNDIETFTVLKDASATAIYGSRASNGVIIITTKKGAEGKVHIEYQGNFSINEASNSVEVLNSKVFRNTIEKNYPLQTAKLGDSETDWANEIFNTTTSNSHSVSISGKKSFLPYRASIGYDMNNGILKTSSSDRFTAALNLNPKFFEDHLSVSLNTKYMKIQNQFADEVAIGEAIAMDPTQTPYDASAYEQYGGYFTWVSGSGDPITVAPQNALAMLEQKSNIASVQRFIGNTQLDYKLQAFPDIKLNLNIGGDYSSSSGEEKITGNAAWNSGAFERGGYTNEYSEKKRNELLEFYAKYNKELASVKSQIEVMGGYSWQHFWYEKENSATYKIADSEGNYGAGNDFERSENYLISFFGRMNYSMQDKYMFTGTIRNDGSSKFVGENQWGLFPSAAFAWRINKEKFMLSYKAINNLKLRLGVGVTGQQDIGSNYPALGTYSFSNSENAVYIYKNSSYETDSSRMYRPDAYDEKLRWEETTTYNIGLDYGFYNDRITGSLERYMRNTKDLLNEVTVPAGANFKNSVYSNVGNMKVQGFEISTVTRIISTAKLRWKVGANGAYNQAEITKLTISEDPDYIGVQHGNINGATGNQVQIHRVGETPGSFYVYQQKYDEKGKPIEGEFEDLNDNGRLDAGDLRVYNSYMPKFTYGLNSSIAYKQWEFTFSGHGSIGNYVYNNVASANAYTDRLAPGAWLSNISSDIYNTNFQKNEVSRYLSDYYVQKADFFRLDNITIAYTFEKLKKLKPRVYFTVNNVFVITPYEGLDPEIQDGIDNDIYPRPRIYMLGLNMSL